MKHIIKRKRKKKKKKGIKSNFSLTKNIGFKFA